MTLAIFHILIFQFCWICATIIVISSGFPPVYDKLFSLAFFENGERYDLSFENSSASVASAFAVSFVFSLFPSIFKYKILII